MYYHKSELVTQSTSPPQIARNTSHAKTCERVLIETRPAEVVANIAICLIHQTNYLLDQQIRKMEQAFVKDGGMRERMTQARLRERSRQNRSRRSGNQPGEGNR